MHINKLLALYSFITAVTVTHAGAVAGRLLGLVMGGNKTGIVQAAGASFSGNQAQEAVVKKCLSGRGYMVLN